MSYFIFDENGKIIKRPSDVDPFEMIIKGLRREFREKQLYSKGTMWHEYLNQHKIFSTGDDYGYVYEGAEKYWTFLLLKYT